MSRQPRLEFSGAVYHVIARGNEQREVFRDDADRELYLRRLAHYQTRFRFRLYAYCLMTNHIHLALETGQVPLSRVVLALHGSYAQAFNQRHDRVGHLFQGRYKALLVQKSSYLLALVRYIHENPVKAGIVQHSRLFRWSSDRFYCGETAPDWLDTRGLFELFGADPARAARRYRTLMTAQLAQGYEDLEPISRVIKGDDRFADTAFARAGGPARPRAWSVERVADVVARRAHLGIDDLRSRRLTRQRSQLRAMAGYVAWKYCRIPLARAAEFFRRDGSTLVRDLQKLELALRGRKELRDELAAILRELGDV